MGRKQGPRKGSMQVWPRVRAERFLPGVNWKPILEVSAKKSGEKPNLLGFIGYKAGMASAFVKDNTPDSMTKGKKVIVPVTVIECPTAKILSIRFYKNGIVSREILNDNLDKELKKVIRLPSSAPSTSSANSSNKKSTKEMLEKININDFNDVRVVIYSQAKKTELKKSPDILEIAVSGNSIADKLNFIKENLAKEISAADVFSKGLVDFRGVTKGKGFQGVIRRFGVHYRSHKAEKGQKRVGSIGGWHPIGVRFTVPRPGQMGLHTRICYNNLLIAAKKYTSEDPVVKRLFDNFGFVKNDYLIVQGSVQGPCKRQVIITPAFRISKRQQKRQYELVELR